MEDFLYDFLLKNHSAANLHEVEALTGGKTWTKENLKDLMKEKLIEYAIGKLNET